MSLQDVSNDSSIAEWLRQSGHGHLLDNEHQFSKISSSAFQLENPSVFFDPQTDNHDPQSYDVQRGPSDCVSSPTQFLAPHTNQQQIDANIENMLHDPNTRIVRRSASDDVVYKQRVYVRYLQPPSPPSSGPIIVREKQLPPPPPDPPLVLKRTPPPPPSTPPPVVIREHPPPIPPPEGTTIIDKVVPAPAKPPRQVIIEQYPPPPPKPQDVIIERWLPYPPRQRHILYQRLPAPLINSPTSTRPIIVQHGQPQVRIHREVTNLPALQYPCQHVSSQTGSCQQACSTLSSSSLISYNPCSTIQPTYCCTAQPQSNIAITQKGYPCAISLSPYRMPITCVCSCNCTTGLGGYGCGITTIPTIGHYPGEATIFNVPDNVPIDNILRQFGIDPCSIQCPTHRICSSQDILMRVTNCA